MAAEKTTIETAKQRSLRVPLGHYRSTDSLGRFKTAAAVLALLAAAAYVVWLLLPSSAARQHLSPGPVTVSHAMWDNDCAQCHLDFRPQRSDAVDFMSLVGTSAAQVQDQACVRCHPGPPHHRNVKADGAQSCATCHSDHLGREANITRSSDVHCTGCHADIASNRSGPGGSPPFVNVTAFALPAADGESPHPKFRSLESDPGTIKFNHWLHMQPGISLPEGRKQLKVSDLPEADRAKYSTFKNEAGLVQLACASCHRLDPTEGPTVADTMAPITYERHCRACHPLDVQAASGEANPLSVPHGLSVARVTALVEGLLAEVERKPLAKSPPTADESGDSPLIPGRTLGKNLAQKIAADALARRGTALNAIHVKCQQCHEVEPTLAGNPAAQFLPEVRPSNVPKMWLKHGRFAHAAHEHLHCRDCHKDAYAYENRTQPQMILPGNEQLPAGYTAAADCDQVMIANLENCVTCHTPASKGGGGARHDCAECHRYHHASEAATTPPKVASEAPTAESQTSNAERQKVSPFESNLRPSLLSLKLVSHRADLRSSVPSLVGAASCAASGCHGDPRPGATHSASAFQTWLTRDPHARAYDVLWTFRGREMTRLLSPGESKSTALIEHQLSDQQHRQVLEQKCVGCHATPPNHDHARADSDYALGVHCESCHGAAGGWLFEHQRLGATAKPGTGQINTKNLEQRAEACMGCHVGPSLATGSPQPVDHDLIAAGHPRLNFEFHSYFQSLPAHWDRSRDEKAVPGAFHFQAWKVGQAKQSAQLAELTKHFTEKQQTGVADFALMNCFACHHALTNDPARQQSSQGRDLLAPAAPLTVPSSLSAASAAQATRPPHQRVAVIQDFVNQAAQPEQSSWDHSLQAFLAVRAVTADLSPAPTGPASASQSLDAAMHNFQNYLAQECFALARPVTPYDSPTQFTASAAQKHHQAVSRSLQELQAALAAHETSTPQEISAAIP